jgi:hypothetical protein
MVLPGDADQASYVDEVVFTNKRMLQIIQNILTKTKIPPIIILQGDHNYSHGPERVKILNAYFLPGGGDTLLYDSITPINTFRIIFDYYFGYHLGFLPDDSYLADDTDATQITSLPDSCIDDEQ